MLLSNGMSGWAELDGAVARLREAGADPLAILQCTSAYPVAPERVGLNVLREIQERYGCATGLSDHSGTIFPALAAVALSGRVIEVHVTLSREMFDPDVAASVTTSEFALLARGVRYIGAALTTPVDKDEVATELAPMRVLFGRSLLARCALPAGHVLAASGLTAKKPAGGIPQRGSSRWSAAGCAARCAQTSHCRTPTLNCWASPVRNQRSAAARRSSPCRCGAWRTPHSSSGPG